MNKFIYVGLCLFLLLGLNGCNKKNISIMSNNKKSHIVTDCIGREVEVPVNVERIVDLTYSDATRVLIELGADDKIVGMSDLCLGTINRQGMIANCFVIISEFASRFNGIQNVGNHKEPSIEGVVGLNPDVIFVGIERREFAQTLQTQLQIPVVCLGTYGAFNYDIFKVAGEVTGTEERASELVSYIKNKVNIVSKIIDTIPVKDRKSVYFWSRPKIGDPRTNASYEAFEIAGGILVAKDGNVIPESVYKVTKEQIIKWNPSYIFVHKSFIKKVPGWHTLDTIRGDEILQDIDAIKNNKLYPIRGHLRGWDIASEVTELFYIAKILYPNKFTNVDVEREGNEILKKFYNIDNLYTEMSTKLNLYKFES